MFLATMSHEIRTPMQGTMDMVDVLRLTCLDDEQQEYADAIDDTAASLLGLLTDILDFSKIDARKLELVRVRRILQTTSSILGMQAALRAVAACTPAWDLLLDVQLPGMDGLEATRRIRKAEQARGREVTLIVAVTAHALKGDRERFLEAGMSDYIAKPVNIRQLRQVLQRILDA